MESWPKLPLLTFLVLLLIGSPHGLACRQSHGESAADKMVAEKLCKIFKGEDHILQMSVQESILYVDVTRLFFKGMKEDKIAGTGIVKAWMRLLRQEVKSKAVTVWVYVDSVKVVEGQTSFLGEDRVKFLL